MKQPNRIDSQPAFLLSATPWRETSLLAELFSRDYGRVAVVARSARKRQSELRGVLVPFVPVQVAFGGIPSARPAAAVRQRQIRPFHH